MTTPAGSEREAFEEWARKCCLATDADLVRCGSGYAGIIADGEWATWQAAYRAGRAHSADQVASVAERRAQASVAGGIPAATSLVFTLREADALFGLFGGEQGEVTVRMLPAGAIKAEEGDPDPSPAGLWGHMTDYPEEGAVFLGACDPDEDYEPERAELATRAHSAAEPVAKDAELPPLVERTQA